MIENVYVYVCVRVYVGCCWRAKWCRYLICAILFYSINETHTHTHPHTYKHNLSKQKPNNQSLQFAKFSSEQLTVERNWHAWEANIIPRTYKQRCQSSSIYFYRPFGRLLILVATNIIKLFTLFFHIYFLHRIQWFYIKYCIFSDFEWYMKWNNVHMNILRMYALNTIEYRTMNFVCVRRRAYDSKRLLSKNIIYRLWLNSIQFTPYFYYFAWWQQCSTMCYISLLLAQLVKPFLRIQVDFWMIILYCIESFCILLSYYV